MLCNLLYIIQYYSIYIYIYFCQTGEKCPLSYGYSFIKLFPNGTMEQCSEQIEQSIAIFKYSIIKKWVG